LKEVAPSELLSVSLEQGSLSIANCTQDRQRRGESNTDLFLADINAYRSQFSEAAKLYRKAGCSQRAADMYTDLRMFELAKV